MEDFKIMVRLLAAIRSQEGAAIITNQINGML